MRLRRRLICVALLIATGVSAPGLRAQDPSSPASDEIVVTGIRESTLDLKRLIKGREAFLAGRAAFAPTSSLYFQLRPAPGVSLEGMRLTLRKDNEDIPVAIDGEGRFSLPALPVGRWELVHNRGAGRIAIRALVLSAGADEADRPLGDLRLQCRVSWELKKSTYSIFARGGFDAIGGCASGQIAFFFLTPKPIAAARIDYGAKSQDLPVKEDRSSYRAPLSDKTLPNGAMIHVRYG